MKITLLIISCLLALAADLAASRKAKRHRHVKASTKSLVQGTSEVLSTRSETKPVETGVQTPETGVQTPETGVQTPETEVQTPETGVQTPETGVQTKETDTVPPPTREEEDKRYSVYGYAQGLYQLISTLLPDYDGQFAFIMMAPTQSMKYAITNKAVVSALSDSDTDQSLSELITNAVFPEDGKSNLVIAGVQEKSGSTAENNVAAQFSTMNDNFGKECPYLILFGSNTEACYGQKTAGCQAETFIGQKLAYQGCPQTKWVVYVFKAVQKDYELEATKAFENKYDIWPYIELDYDQTIGGSEEEQEQKPPSHTSVETPETSVVTSTTDTDTPVVPIGTGNVPQHRHHHIFVK